jgi:hypothetical protein
MNQIIEWKKILYFVALPLILLLSACGPSNTLIGKWESEPIMGGMTSTLEFTGSSVASASKVMGMEQTQEVKVKEYKVEKEQVGVVVAQGANSMTMWYQILDSDTIAQDLGIMKLRYHRKK